MRERLDREYFESLYERSRDPWDFETSGYEREKYTRTLGVLAQHQRSYGRALEVGCSIGVFTAMLAPLCEEVLAVDVSERALAVARARLKDSPHVRLEPRRLPEEMPGGPFDLIVASEVLYYWPRDLMLAALRRFEEALAPGGVLLAIHWRGETKTYPLQGDEVHELLSENTRLTNTARIVEPEYRLDLFEAAL
ncbi:MAG: Methyltransferase type 12 [uncultured Rubrobacteraceae bacterium]|uniref:Methyltransferase type 12 n=1 Tax=uncultured Rubrobacteraceae bacterium TaxID=349277 RepID=A0A6J4QS37_9ACTN|nr:MAG: Methyltransferase type 12 [uncultured Rubrobacteraceae bacterium]